MASYESAITFLYSRDLARVAAWYEGALGLELAIDQGSCRIYRVAGQGFVGFCERDAAGGAEGFILTFVTDDVQGAYERLVAFGATVEHPPRENPRYGIFHFFARDPDGRRVEVQRFLSPEARAICHMPRD